MEEKQLKAIQRAEEILAMYKSIGSSGFFGVSTIPQIINKAKIKFESGTSKEKKEALEELLSIE